MGSWQDARFAVVDIETTGLDPRRHELLSIGLVPVEGGRVRVGSSIYRTMRPLVAPNPANVIVHGIRPSEAMAASDPRDAIEAIAAALDGRILVAHVATIEKGFLRPWLRRYGRELPRRVVDTDVLVRLILLREHGSKINGHVGLGAAAALFGVPEHQRHHALGDALTTAQLLLAAATTMGPHTTLHDLVAAPRRLRRLDTLTRTRQVLHRASGHGRP